MADDSDEGLWDSPDEGGWDSPGVLEKEEEGQLDYSENNTGLGEDCGTTRFFDLRVSRDIWLPLCYKTPIKKPWPVQSSAISCIHTGKDVVVRASPKKGKTLGYLICIAESFYFLSKTRFAPVAIIILPTIELCQKVHKEFIELTKICEPEISVALMSCPTTFHELESPHVVVSTPPLVLSFLALGLPPNESLEKYLQFLVLDEVDLLFSPGFEDDLTSVKSIVGRIPSSCQCLVFSADPSADVSKLKSVVKHNPYVVTLTVDGSCEAELSPYNFEHLYLPCREQDKLVYLESFYQNFMRDKVVIFTNSDDKSLELKCLLQQVGAEPKVLLAELTEDSRTLEVSNARDSLLLIVTDQPSESHVFEEVDVVVHFDMPPDAAGYRRRVLSTRGPANMIGLSVSMATRLDKGVFEDMKLLFWKETNFNTGVLVPVPWYGWITDKGLEICENPAYSPEELLNGGLDIWLR